VRLGVSGAAWRAHKAGAVVRPLGSGRRAGHGGARSGRRLEADATGKEERKEGRKGGKERKRKKGEGKKEKKIGKEMKKKKNGEKGERERKKEGEGRCAPAATATAVGHAWRAAAGGGARGRRGERKKEGARFAASGRDTSRRIEKWMGRELKPGAGLFRRISGT